MNKKLILETIGKNTKDHGLFYLGQAPLDVAQDFRWFEKWLAEGRQADMQYLEKYLEVRKDPKKLLDGAKSALVFGLPYYLGDKWQRGPGHATPQIAMYARLLDYHKVVKKILTDLMEDLKTRFVELERESYRVTVDSAPLLERAVTASTGQGFIGKNTCYIHPKLGSFLLLGEIIVTWGIDDAAASETPKRVDASKRTPLGGCGSCKRCQVHCPTGALDQDYQIDARRCLSWWTIENRGPIPEEYWKWIGQYMFGCDICQLVCPWNRGLEVSPHTTSLLKISNNLDAYEVAVMDEKKYLELFAKTPATRAKKDGLVRNALIALHVRGDPRIDSAMLHLDDDPSEVIRHTISTIKRRGEKSQSTR
jgi:epoxyqueuosine reductase